MKRNILLLLVALLPAVASAYDAYINGIYYNLSGNEAEVTYYSSPESVIYNGNTYRVTRIGANAFHGCYSYAENIGLTSISIPNTVTSIGSYAFDDCKSLTSVTIPNSVTSISERAFQRCSGLTSIRLSDNMASISNYTFYNCSNLISVMIPEGVTSIGEGVFWKCEKLTSVTIPNSVTTIGLGAFDGCSSLASITIPNNVTNIGKYAFSGCTSLTSITIPYSVTSFQQQSGKIAACCKQDLDSQIINKKVQSRFSVVEEGKHGLHKHIAGKSSANESIDPVDGDSSRGHCQKSRLSVVCVSFPGYRFYHSIHMHPEMKTHQDITPIGKQHMDLSCSGS